MLLISGIAFSTATGIPTNSNKGLKHEFNSSGVSYNVVIYKDGVHLRTDIVTKTEGRIENLPSGNLIFFRIGFSFVG